MEHNSIDRIRSATFPVARRGYDTREVERFLNRLADWLETGGDDQARAEVIKRELERVGERTAGVLASAEESAEAVRGEAAEEARETLQRARAEAGRLRGDAETYAAEQREEADAYVDRERRAADSYAGQTRSAADEDARSVRADADEYAARTRAESDEEAREILAEAEAKARRIVEEGIRRRRDLEAVISDLVERRDAVIEQAEQLAEDLRRAAAEHAPGDGEDHFATPGELDPEERVKA